MSAPVRTYTPVELRNLIPRPAPESVNSGLYCPSAEWMTERLGPPNAMRTQQRLKIVTRHVGPFSVSGASIAVLGLEHVWDDVVRAQRNDLYDNVISNGMYNLRRIRGSSNWSNHAWGMANDNNFGPGEEMGDGKVQFGLMELYPFFYNRGWYWGGGYLNREDAMHWEPSTSLIENWIKMGML